MRNLTEQQRQLVDGIISEFESINKKCSATECDDLIAMIDGAISEKERFRNEIMVSNKAYDEANRIQVLDYISKMNALLNRYGYDCELHHEGNSRTERCYTHYFLVRINWHGHYVDGYSDRMKTTSFYFYSRGGLKYDLFYLKEVGLDFKINYQDSSSYDFNFMMDRLAQLIIDHKQSLIK